jgi:hypothetical protein
MSMTSGGMNVVTKLKSLEARAKILSEDRRNFLKMCKVFGLTDCDLVFESASLNETAVDLDELMMNHAESILRNQHMQTLLVDVLTEVIGSDNAESIPTIIRDRDVSILRSILQQRKSDQSRPTTLAETRSSQTDATPTLVETQTSVSSCDQSIQTESVVNHELDAAIHKAENDLQELRNAVSAKDEEIMALQKRIEEVSVRSDQTSLLEDAAIRQAARDAEVSHLKAQLSEAARAISPSSTDDQRSILRKNIFIKVLTYSIAGEFGYLEHMVPIIRATFDLDDDETNELAKLCESLKNNGLLGNILPQWK